MRELDQRVSVLLLRPELLGPDLVLGKIHARVPRDGELHIWRLALDRCDPAGLLERLAPDEQGRAQRYVFDRDRRRFVVARFALRSILARYVGTPLPDNCFEFGPNGKPVLARSFATARLEFNVSHSDERALIAVTRGGPVGIDVERIRVGVDIAGVSRMVFSATERATLLALPEGDQLAEFFRSWTRKEALLKCVGWGFGGRIDPRTVTVQATSSGYLTLPEFAERGGHFFLSDLPLDAHHTAAVVLAGDCSEIHFGDWILPEPT